MSIVANYYSKLSQATCTHELSQQFVLSEAGTLDFT